MRADQQMRAVLDAFELSTEKPDTVRPVNANVSSVVSPVSWTA